MDYYALLFFRYLKSKGSKGLRMIYDAFKGGTEQLLPVNTDTPTTSPIIADIQYTDALRENQEFTYRECPITVDGRAKIKSIKGNTLKWNQIFPTRTVNYTGTGYTLSSTGDGKFVLTVTETATQDASVNHFSIPSSVFKEGHKYYIRGNTSDIYILIKSVPTDMKERIWVAPNFVGSNISVTFTDLPVGTYTLYPQAFDLTAMFGSTKADEIYAMEQSQSGSGVAYFRSLFPLPYYAYDSGSLLSFNGTGIKTVGFNQWDEEWELCQYGTIDGGKYTDPTRVGCKNPIPVLPNTTYYFNTNGVNINTCFYDAQMNILWNQNGFNNTTKTTPSNCHYICFNLGQAYGTTYKNDICINISDPSKNGTYEPYQSSTLDIPTSTYFPNGMMGWGTAYDEMTNTKAIHRMNQVDLGSYTWSYNSTYDCFVVSGQLNPLPKNAYIAVCSKYPYVGGYGLLVDKSCAYIYNNGFAVRDSSYSSASDFKTGMDGVMLQYELAEESSVDVDQSDTDQLLNNALSTIMGRSVSSNNPQQVLDVLTKGE